ncbi:uncharacterized protein LOC114283778 [Camellia sinensis]|nr:uncharacterized protein LOC114283778 [Camellia sinensis]
MEMLLVEIEKVGGRVVLAMEEHNARKSQCGNGIIRGQDFDGSVCCFYKHSRNVSGDQWVGSLKCDVIKMLIRGSDYSHALCMHVCEGSSEFHVYSKKGWVSFCPDTDAIVITIGDQIQAWSGGLYKQVIGRPIFKGENEECISMAFLYSPSKNIKSFKTNEGKTISLGQQAIVAILFTLVYHFLVYIYKL